MFKMLLKMISTSGLLLSSLLASGVQAQSDRFLTEKPTTNPSISFTDPTNGASDCLTGNNITHYEKCSPAGELERQALYRSPFFGLLMIYQKAYDLHDKMKTIIDKRSLTNEEIKKFIHMEHDIVYHMLSYLREYFRPTNQVRSCYHLRVRIINKIKTSLERDKVAPVKVGSQWKGTRWFNDAETKIMNDIIGYIPKWWEHTDLGFACKLFVEETKNIDGVNEDINGVIGYTAIDYLTENSGARIPLTRSRINKNKIALEKVITVLKKVLGVEILEARAHFNGPLNKICSPHTDQHYVTGDISDPSSPAWHKVFSSAALDTTQYPTTTYPVHNILLSAHPSQNYSSDEVKKHLMTKDPRYITFYSSTPQPNPKEGYYPGLPMIFVPGTDYEPPALLSGGITVYAYPPAVCTKDTDSDLPIRIFN